MKRKTKSKNLNCYDSMAAAAAKLGVPTELLQWAKSQGAPGFRNTRIWLDELRPWLRKNRERGKAASAMAKEKAALKTKLLRQRIEHEAWENSRARGEWIKKADVDVALIDLAERLKSKLRQLLRNELPPKLEGLRAAEIAAKLDNEVIGGLLEIVRRAGLGPGQAK